jgi:hypothetical protein
MNFKSIGKGFFNLGKHQSSDISASKIDQKDQDSGFSFKLYALVTFLLLGSVGGINWLVDPLWYSQGNILTGKNFAFNERITKTNLFFRTKNQAKYDCVILGSSRAIALRPSNFQENKCFNYSLKGGEILDFVNYSNFLKDQGLEPQKVYIGVDGLNFVEKDIKAQAPLDINTVATQSPLQAYFSVDVLLFSAMTLLGVSPDPGNYYDRNFEAVDFDHPPVYKPDFYKPLEEQKCDLSAVKMFADLRQVFPNAEFIGYAPPVSAWSIINDTYGRDLMDCQLTAVHQLAQTYDVMYDFTAPSEVTKNPDYTFDGSHYSVAINNKIAAILQGQSDANFGIRVDKYKFDEYRNIYQGKLRGFLAENNELKRWQE